MDSSPFCQLTLAAVANPELLQRLACSMLYLGENNACILKLSFSSRRVKALLTRCARRKWLEARTVD